MEIFVTQSSIQNTGEESTGSAELHCTYALPIVLSNQIINGAAAAADFDIS